MSIPAHFIDFDHGFSCSGSPPLIPRVLDVVKSQLCFIVGTVYIDMLQKPNVLEDVARDVSDKSLHLSFFYYLLTLVVLIFP